MQKIKSKVESAKKRITQLKPPITVQLADYYSHIVRLFIVFTLASFVILVTILFLVSNAYQKSVENSRGTVKEYYYWREVVKIHPDFPDGLIQAARYAYALGYKDEALGYLEQALIQDPKSEKALRLRNTITED